MHGYFAILLAVFIALPAAAHPGKTDRDGGHKCYKECAEWNLYYAEYHLHDKDGKPVKVARKKQVRPTSESAPLAESPVVGIAPADRPGDPAPAQPVAAAVVESDNTSLPWMLIVLFFLLFFVIRRKRRKALDEMAGKE